MESVRFQVLISGFEILKGLFSLKVPSHASYYQRVGFPITTSPQDGISNPLSVTCNIISSPGLEVLYQLFLS